ncbi:Cytochrome P450 4V2 [Tyrophagus putrescentiae]|nr:Cytochrome P450 4V2 [Tyrophagus putrescentiae]
MEHIHFRHIIFTTIRILVTIFVLNFFYQVISKRYRRFTEFSKLPRLPIIGPVGWLIGNLDTPRRGGRQAITFLKVFTINFFAGIVQILNGLRAIDGLEKHGFLSAYLGHEPVVAFFREDSIRCLMTSAETNISKGDQNAFLYPWLGRGVLIANGSHWKTHRRLLDPVFKSTKLQNFLPLMSAQVQIMLHRIASSASRVMDVRLLMDNVSLDMITATIMGASVGAQLETTNREEYIEPIKEATKLFVKRIMNPLHQNDLIYSLSTEGRKYASTVKQIHRFVKQVIDERKKEIQSNCSAHQQHPVEFTEEDIFGEVNTFMFAGHETTSSSCVAALLLIASDNRVQNLLFRELESVLKDCDSVDAITVEHCKRMQYMEMVIQEAMRLYSPIPLMVKKIQHDLVVNGHTVPAGCTALVCFTLLHNDPNVFTHQSPHSFYPERFSPECAIHRMPYAFMPFSVGPRSCIGKNFSIIEMKLVLAAILRKYQLIAITKRDEMRLGFAAVLKVNSSVLIRFEDRQKRTVKSDMYLIYRFITRVIHELQIIERFNKLPKLPTAGFAGLLLGNVDSYYYSMRHLPIPQGAIQMICAVFQFESLRNGPGFIAMHIGYQKVVVFFRADTVESLVSSTINITKSEHYDYMKPWLGNGLLTSSGDHWRRHRKALTPAFHFKLLESFAPVMNSNVKILLNRVEKSPNQEIDIRGFICDMALDIICETAMGTNVGAQSETDDKEAYRRPIEIATEQLVGRFVNPFYRSDLIYNLSADGKENRRVMGKIHQFVKKVIKERKEFIQNKLQKENQHYLDNASGRQRQSSSGNHCRRVGTNPKHFPKPEQYIPERFLADSDVYKVPYAYMPFSAGARKLLKLLQSSAESVDQFNEIANLFLLASQ